MTVATTPIPAHRSSSAFLPDQLADAAPVYLDFAATTPLLPVARSAMVAAMDAGFGNASALHTPGHAAAVALEDARAAVANLINARPTEIIFTSGGSESNNTVTETFRDQAIAVSSIEHSSLLESARHRARRCDELAVDPQGFVQPAADWSPYQLVSVMLANNELGSIQPIADLAQAVHAAGGRFHTDATQALGKIPVDVQALGVDYLTISAHKIGGPIGIGALYVRTGAPFQPLILGGHQEHRRRAGTSNVVLASGFAAAARYVTEHRLPQHYARQIRPLRDQLRARILAEVPYSSINSPATHCLPHLLNASFQAAEGESIQLYLDAAGIAVSTGSACAAGDIQPSHVLMAARHDAEVAHSSIRFSLGPDTTPAEIDRVMSVLPGIVRRLQSISTIKIKEL